MSAKKSNLINVGRVSGLFGIKGWLKIKSSTEPEENILSYSPWWVKTRHGVKQVEVEEANFRPQGLIVRFKDIEDRDAAEMFIMSDVAIERAQLETLTDDEYYWDQLIGLAVWNISDDGKPLNFLGNVDSLIETGANDVIVVKPSQDSVDDQERLIPYAPERYLHEIDLDNQRMLVDWELDY